jgi:hypothetical protein
MTVMVVDHTTTILVLGHMLTVLVLDLEGQVKQWMEMAMAMESDLEDPRLSMGRVTPTQLPSLPPMEVDTDSTNLLCIRRVTTGSLQCNNTLGRVFLTLAPLLGTEVNPDGSQVSRTVAMIGAKAVVVLCKEDLLWKQDRNGEEEGA